MNILFLTLARASNTKSRADYVALMRKFRDAGHRSFIVYPRERKYHLETALYEEDGLTLLGVRTLNLQKTNFLEKGIGTILFEYQYMRAIRKFLRNIRFDLIIYSTPPITFSRVIKKIKKQSPEVKTYLLLKDIFPQNAVDLGMFGQRSLFYKFFRRKEKELYSLSDYIGCMSPANVDYLVSHNDWLRKERIEIAPNAIELEKEDRSFSRSEILSKYDLPLDRPIFIYGGNLGKPQGIPFMAECLELNKDRQDCYFLIVGDGTEYPYLEKWMNKTQPKSVALLKRLPRVDYDLLVRSCSVGLIFLDHRFTIPNFPSRLLSYLEFKMPIIAATDPNSDVGKIAQENGFGLWCESNDPRKFTGLVDKILQADMKQMGERGFSFLCENYLVETLYKTISSHL